jgi:hypothetical protein
MLYKESREMRRWLASGKTDRDKTETGESRGKGDET